VAYEQNLVALAKGAKMMIGYTLEKENWENQHRMLRLNLRTELKSTALETIFFRTHYC